MAKTVIHDENGRSYWGEEDHLQAAQSKSFAQMVFELLSEKQPTSGELKVFELILNLSIDHGPDTPSAVETIKAAKEDKTISEALAAGIMQINDSHGGAMEPAMTILYEIRDKRHEIREFIAEQIDEGRKIPGYGHRIYKNVDPRAELILQELKQLGMGEEFIGIAKDLESELNSQTGKTLPLNIDGAIAVALCSFGWEAKLGKAVFLIARTPGLCGQYLNNFDK